MAVWWKISLPQYWEYQLKIISYTIINLFSYVLYQAKSIFQGLKRPMRRNINVLLSPSLLHSVFVRWALSFFCISLPNWVTRCLLKPLCPANRLFYVVFYHNIGLVVCAVCSLRGNSVYPTISCKWQGNTIFWRGAIVMFATDSFNNEICIIPMWWPAFL